MRGAARPACGIDIRHPDGGDGSVAISNTSKRLLNTELSVNERYQDAPPLPQTVFLNLTSGFGYTEVLLPDHQGGDD